MNTLRIAWKDIKFLLRSKTLLVFSILMPVLMMLMMGYVFPKNLEGNFKGKIGIYSEDPVFSLMLKAKTINANEIVVFSSKDAYVEALAKGRVNAVVIIPKGFMRSEKKVMKVIPNPSNPQAALMIPQMAFHLTENTKKKDIFKFKLVGINGEDFNYYEFMAPGMMAMIAIMVISTGLAASITRERELGTLDGLMVAPISRASVVIGKILAQMLRGLIQALIVLCISIIFFGVKVHGSIFTTILLIVLATFSFVGIGIVITSGIKEQETAQIIMTAITFPMMFFSGVFFPIEQMPKIARYISYIFPLTYAADALRKNIVLGTPIKFLTFDITMLLSFALITSLLATLLFPKLIKD